MSLTNAVLSADYAFGTHKFGGNAQAITSKRWVHHTSFLWDYDRENMLALKDPAKQPKYREVGFWSAKVGRVYFRDSLHHHLSTCSSTGMLQLGKLSALCMPHPVT